MSDELKPCPFCGGVVERYNAMPGYVGGHGFYCRNCDSQFDIGDSDEDAMQKWNTRAERTCRRVPGKMHYGERRPKCSECGYGLGDSRWGYCPKCGAKVVE